MLDRPQAREDDRLAALRELEVLDTAPGPDLQAVVELARMITGMEHAAVNFIGERRQHCAATTVPGGLGDIPREQSLCTTVIDSEHAVHFPDMPNDPEMADHPFVTGVRDRLISYAASPVRAAAQLVVGTVCVFDGGAPRVLEPEQLHALDLLAEQTSRLMELRRLAGSLKSQALQDELTGLPNRRALPALATRPRSGARTYGYLDLDDFKVVNDTAGHHVGDQVLRVIAQRLRTVVRDDDQVVRMGGDEFLLVCEGTIPFDVLRRRVRGAVQQPVDTEAGPFTVGVSIGCTAGIPGEHFDEAVRRADAAMYADKGR